MVIEHGIKKNTIRVIKHDGKWVSYNSKEKISI
jgi:hypothetical protein